MDRGAWWAAVHGIAKSRTPLRDFTFTFHFHALEKEMATHSSVLAWRIPGTEDPSGLLSMGSHRVGHDWSDLAAAATAAEIRGHPLELSFFSRERPPVPQHWDLVRPHTLLLLVSPSILVAVYQNTARGRPVPWPCSLTGDSSHGKRSSASLYLPNRKWVHDISENKLYLEPQMQRSPGNAGFLFYLSNLCSRPEHTLPTGNTFISSYQVVSGELEGNEAYFLWGRDCGSREAKGRERWPKERMAFSRSHRAPPLPPGEKSWNMLF